MDKAFLQNFSFPVRYSSVKPTACQLLWKRSQNVSSLRGDARQGRGVVPGRWVKYFCKIYLFRYATPQSSLRLASSSGRGAKMSPLLEEMPGRAEESSRRTMFAPTVRRGFCTSAVSVLWYFCRGEHCSPVDTLPDIPGRWVKYFCKISLFRYATPQSSLRLASSSGRGAKMSPLLEKMPGRAEESTPTPSSNETKTYSRSRL